MKNRLLNLIKKSTLPVLLVGSLLALSSPATLLAEGRGGGHGGGGRSYSGSRSGGSRSYGGERRGYGGGERNYGREGHFRGDDHVYRGGRYYGGAYGYYGGPALSYPYGCDPAGYYDQWGNWVPYAGCYAGPWGY